MRISGPLAPAIARTVLGKLPAPRYATRSPFTNAEGETLDSGLALFFPAPASYTGEDVLELHGHGGPVVLDMLLECVLRQGARQAQPGEFTQRAFLNDKLDLAQAEAVADLIDAQTRAAALSARRSLDGAFSREVHALTERLVELRTWTEAAIDFPEEEIDFLSTEAFAERLGAAVAHFREVCGAAERGVLLHEGVNLAIVGAPNVGKSTLLNLLAGRDAAIVTDIPGTTRDALREHLQVDGLPVHITDTAGLRETEDPVEKEGIRRTRRAMGEADAVLYMVAHDPAPEEIDSFLAEVGRAPLLVVRNKIDLCGTPAAAQRCDWGWLIRMSALSGEGLELLQARIVALVGYRDREEGSFTARRRHLEALARGYEALCAAEAALRERRAGELAAEDLRRSVEALGEITGAHTTEDLLGRIFSTFCIGK